MARTKARRGRNVAAGGTDTIRELSKAGAVGLLSVGCNILAPYLRPLHGAFLVSVGIALYLFSLKEAASLRAQARRHPFWAFATCLVLAGALIFTVRSSYRALEKLSPAKQQSSCGSAGSAAATGTGNVAVSGCENSVGGKSVGRKEK